MHHGIWKIIFVLGADEYLKRLKGKIRKYLFFYVKIFKRNSLNLQSFNFQNWDRFWTTLISLINEARLLILKKKIHPPRKFPASTFDDFLDFFQPPLHVYLCTSFFQKIPPSTFIPTSTFIDLATFAPPPRLFQPPRLLERWVDRITVVSNWHLWIGQFWTTVEMREIKKWL